MPKTVGVENPYKENLSDETTGAPLKPLWPMLALIVSGLVIYVLLLVLSFAAGFALGDLSVHNQMADERVAKIRNVLDSDREAYGKLEVYPVSQGNVMIVGQVSSAEIKAELYDKLVALFGEEYTKGTIGPVEVVIPEASEAHPR